MIQYEWFKKDRKELEYELFNVIQYKCKRCNKLVAVGMVFSDYKKMNESCCKCIVPEYEEVINKIKIYK